MYDLTGKWSCNDGATYYVRQIGHDVSWYGEKFSASSSFSNLATGVYATNSKLYLNWVDVPKGTTTSAGILKLAVQSNNKFLVEDVTGGFGGSVWTRI